MRACRLCHHIRRDSFRSCEHLVTRKLVCWCGSLTDVGIPYMCLPLLVLVATTVGTASYSCSWALPCLTLEVTAGPRKRNRTGLRQQLRHCRVDWSLRWSVCGLLLRHSDMSENKSCGVHKAPFKMLERCGVSLNRKVSLRSKDTTHRQENACRIRTNNADDTCSKAFLLMTLRLSFVV